MSDTENKFDILYRPDLELDKSYYADGKLDTSKIAVSTTTSETETQNMQAQIESLKQLLLFIPGEIRSQTESILNLVHFLLIITETSDGDADDNTYQITKPDSNPGTNNDAVNQFFKDHTPVTILKENLTDDAKIKRHYSNSTLEITRFYLNRLGDILASYHSQLLLNPKAANYLEENYKTGLTDYKNYVAHSILQTLLKSQQEKISKMRLYQKLYNEKQSLTILKSLEYSKLTLIKTIGNAPKDPKLYYKHIQTIETEKKRLEKKMFEYYRYLDSSLDVLENCLSMHLTEGIAKAELHEINNIKENSQ